jgi:hypothetical protein
VGPPVVRTPNATNEGIARDGGRCVVSGGMNLSYYCNLPEAEQTRLDETQGFFTTTTEAAHLLPHTLNVVCKAGTLVRSPSSFPAVILADTLRKSDTKQYIWSILNMFQPGISNSLASTDIDTPCNALLLTQELHGRLGRLDRLGAWFEPVAGMEHTYTFHLSKRLGLPPRKFLPSAPTISFVNHECQSTIQSVLPDPRLLAIHAACCELMHLSAAAEYVEALLVNAEEMEGSGTLQTDGGSNIEAYFVAKGWGRAPGEIHSRA